MSFPLCPLYHLVCTCYYHYARLFPYIRSYIRPLTRPGLPRCVARCYDRSCPAARFRVSGTCSPRQCSAWTGSRLSLPPLNPIAPPDGRVVRYSPRPPASVLHLKHLLQKTSSCISALAERNSLFNFTKRSSSSSSGGRKAKKKRLEK